MKRIRNAIAVLGLVAAPLAVLASPAEASAVYVCAGTGELLMNDPLYYPVNPGPLPTLNPPTATTFGGTLGVCAATLVTANVNGSVNGHCGRSTGTVSINSHAAAGFQTAGSLVVIAGGNVTVGVANAVPVVGTSCLNGAVRFQVTGVAVTTG